MHQPVTDHRPILYPLLYGVESKDLVGRHGNTDRFVYIVPHIRETNFMTEIPHPHFQRIVKFLLEGDGISPFKNFSDRHIHIGLEKGIAYADKFELMSQALLQIK